MKKLLALVLGVAASTCALADPAFSLGGYTGGIKIKFSNFENIDTAAGTACSPLIAGCINFGVLDVTQILSNSDQVLWNKGQAGGFLSGVNHP